MNYEVLTLEDADRWNEYLGQLPAENQDIYFTPEYYRLYEDYNDGKALCFVFKQKGELALYPFLINSVNELGFGLAEDYYDIQGAYGYNGISSSSLDQVFIDSFFKNFHEFCLSNNIIAEFTRFHPLLKNHLFSSNYMDVSPDRNTVFVNLDQSFNDIYQSFQKTTKKQIRRLIENHGIIIKVVKGNTELLDQLYSIYLESMNRVNSINYLFFNRKYFQELLSLDNTWCFLAYQNDVIISWIAALQYKSYFHGHLGGTLTDYIHLSPFNNLYSEMIKKGIELNCRFLHLGGGPTSSVDDPILNYKLHFSKEQAAFHIGKKVINHPIYYTVVKEWEFKNPAKIENFKNRILKYRF